MQCPSLQRKRKCQLLSGVQLFGTPRTVASQAPLFMGFFRQEYWTELPFSSPGDLPDPGIESRSAVLQVDSLIEAGGILRVPDKPTSDFLSKSAQGSVPREQCPYDPTSFWSGLRLKADVGTRSVQLCQDHPAAHLHPPLCVQEHMCAHTHTHTHTHTHHTQSLGRWAWLLCTKG